MDQSREQSPHKPFTTKQPKSNSPFNSSNSLVFDDNSNTFVWIQGAKVGIPQRTSIDVSGEHDTTSNDERAPKHTTPNPSDPNQDNFSTNKYKLDLDKIQARVDSNNIPIKPRNISKPPLRIYDDSNKHQKERNTIESRSTKRKRKSSDEKHLQTTENNANPVPQLSQLEPNNAIHFATLFTGDFEPWNETTELDFNSNFGPVQTFKNKPTIQPKQEEPPILESNSPQKTKPKKRPEKKKDVAFNNHVDHHFDITHEHRPKIERSTLKLSFVGSIDDHPSTPLPPVKTSTTDNKTSNDPTTDKTKLCVLPKRLSGAQFSKPTESTHIPTFSKRPVSRARTTLEGHNTNIASTPSNQISTVNTQSQSDWHQQRLIATLSIKELKKIFPPLMKQCLQKGKQRKGLETGYHVGSGDSVCGKEETGSLLEINSGETGRRDYCNSNSLDDEFFSTNQIPATIRLPTLSKSEASPIKSAIPPVATKAVSRRLPALTSINSTEQSHNSPASSWSSKVASWRERYGAVRAPCLMDIPLSFSSALGLMKRAET
ncbi:hypothetical protein HK098_004209 [Nowakowskiella sp. JEL0407]|nr:hypothetical protein HK098_004209 [Nowakowskiella sp. JEL0407]